MKVFTKEENQTWSKQLPGKMCSACLILRSGNKVLMVKAGYKDHWTFPSGIVDENESPKTAAIRETFEETGFDAEVSETRSFVTIYTSAKEENDRDRFNFSFIVDLPTQDISLSVPNDEITDAKWVEFNEVANLSKNKGSYEQFQKFLIGGSTSSEYVEI